MQNQTPETGRVSRTSATWARALRVFLGLCGIGALFAMLAVFIPYAWMDAAHQGAGLGKMPSEPVVGYLARSTSLLYAFMGGVFLIAASDVVRYRLVCVYLGATHVILGVVLFGVHLCEGMPQWWAVGEGGVNAAVGVVILYMVRRMRPTGA